MNALLTVDQVSARLQVSPKTVRALIARRKLVAYKVSKYLRIEPDSVERYLSGVRLALVPPAGRIPVVPSPARRAPRAARRTPGCELTLKGADYFSRPRRRGATA